MPAGSDDSRPRGILSEADRKYLRDPEAYAEAHSRQSLIERREAIQERIRNAILDFTIIQRSLTEDLRDEIFDVDLFDSYDMYAGMAAAMALFYELQEVSAEWEFDQLLGDAVDKTWENPHRNPRGKVRVAEIPWEPQLKDRQAEERLYVMARKKFLQHEPLTNRELGVLVKGGNLPIDEDLDALREQLRDATPERTPEASIIGSVWFGPSQRGEESSDDRD